MKNLVNNTKSILTLPQKTILQVGDNNVADKIVEELQKHPTVAKMIKDKQIEVKAAAPSPMVQNI